MGGLGINIAHEVCAKTNSTKNGGGALAPKPYGSAAYDMVIFGAPAFDGHVLNACACNRSQAVFPLLPCRGLLKDYIYGRGQSKLRKYSLIVLYIHTMLDSP